MNKYCCCCGFDLEQCPGCGFTHDPEEEEVCPNCGADIPNGCILQVFQIPQVVSRDETLEHFMSL